MTTMNGRVRDAAAIALVWAGGGTVVDACPVCFQIDDPSASAGVSAAVLVLAAVTIAVLVPCAAFALRLARRDGASSSPAVDP
ncbi:MAG: hypothetical protein IT184_04815 [Acidobacteria bacterium]|nr:hypothetical protein [Acidobacteriota bacterium]